MEKENKIVLIIGAGGSGKSTIANHIIEKHENYKIAVSTTSRKMRPNEKHGESYFFVDKDEFKQMIDRGEFLEWVLLADDYYGTNKNKIMDILQSKHCICVIDCVGAKRFKKMFPDRVVSFYIYIPLKELKQRLILRGDSPEKIQKRLKLAKIENAQKHDFDFILRNFEGKSHEVADKIVSIVEREN